MFLAAIKDLNIDKKNSFMIGDTEKDYLAAKKTGIKFIQVGKKNFNNNIKFKDLRSAINFIFKTWFSLFPLNLKHLRLNIEK